MVEVSVVEVSVLLLPLPVETIFLLGGGGILLLLLLLLVLVVQLVVDSLNGSLNDEVKELMMEEG